MKRDFKNDELRDIAEEALREAISDTYTSEGGIDDALIFDICAGSGLDVENHEECISLLRDLAHTGGLDLAGLLKAMLDIVEQRGGIVQVEVNCSTTSLALDSDGMPLVLCDDVPVIRFDKRLHMHLA